MEREEWKSLWGLPDRRKCRLWPDRW